MVYEPLMRYYPLFINLERMHCLVVGGGGVGCRKARSLAEAGACSVLVVDTAEASEDMETVCTSCGNVCFARREFVVEDLDGINLAFACTSDSVVNGKIAQQCERRGILCNIADQPDRGHFIVPGSVRRGDLCIAVSTAGKSPAMARRVRAEIDGLIGDEYGLVLALMGRLRPRMLDLGLETRQNTDVFRSLVFSELADALKVRDKTAARGILMDILPDTLHNNIPELLDGLV